jgi:syntaxin 5
MPIQDRTNEFRACVQSIRSRSAYPSRREDKQKLLQNGKASGSKSEFTQMASSIGKEISSTNLKLNKLAQRMSLYLHPSSKKCSLVFSGKAENAV